MATPYTAAKYLSGIKAIFGLGLMMVGFVIARGPMLPVGVVLAAYGCFQAARNFAMMIRIVAAEQLLTGSGGQQRVRLEREFRRATVPRKTFLLLFALAEIDGTAGPRERDLVRSFLLPRYPDLRDQLMSWEGQRLSTAQLDELVHELRAMLTFSECVTVFSWCCYVALIDRKFNPTEHDVLQRVSRHFGLPPHHARQVFLQAKNRILGSEHGQQRQRHGGYGEPRPTGRIRALEVLGLDGNATDDEIRKRHRELAKRFHPDAHSHLGPVAAEEATERFREIQAAYEILTRSA